jgi:hypothetical protein
MDKPNSKFPTMGTTAASGAQYPSAKPERGKLMKKGNTAAGTLDGKKGAQAMKHATSKRAYGIKTTMPSWKDPQIGPTQGNGRLFKSAVNRTAPNFTDGMADYN